MSTPIRHLLIFNLVVDADDPVLSFATEWVNHFARHCKQVTVITMRSGRLDVARNVSVLSVGQELGRGRLLRMIAFWRILFGELRSKKFDACFSHMMPVFSSLGFPLLRFWKVPLVTWYSHPKRNLWVSFAAIVSQKLVTAFESSFGGIRTGKLELLGQGIDTSVFTRIVGVPTDNTVLCVGRIAPAKRLEILLSAFARVISQSGISSDLKLKIVGKVASGDGERYLESLILQARDLGISERVEWIRGIPRESLPRLYSACLMHVNLTPRGFGDKVALEAMSCGLPSLIANPEVALTLGEFSEELYFDYDDIAALAVKMGQLLLANPMKLCVMKEKLPELIRQNHSLHSLVQRVLQILRSLMENR